MNWKGSSRLFGTFVKNLFLGPFTVARVSARVEEIHHRALTPSSDADTAECRADNSGDQLKGRRSWWPTAFALACFFYGSIACQVRLEFFRKLTKFLIFDSDFPPKLKAFLIHRIFPLKSAIRRSLDLASLFLLSLENSLSNSFSTEEIYFCPNLQIIGIFYPAFPTLGLVMYIGYTVYVASVRYQVRVDTTHNIMLFFQKKSLWEHTGNSTDLLVT